MIFSIILISVPTAILTFVFMNSFDIIGSPICVIMMYYFYLFSTVFLFIAGSTDPGIFERKYVNND